MNSHDRRKWIRRRRRQLVAAGYPHVEVRNWEDLSKLKPSATHRLEIDVEGCNGWIHALDKAAWNALHGMEYLSTHAFYRSTWRETERKLLARGFNATINPGPEFDE